MLLVAADVRVNGRRARKGMLLRAGDRVEVRRWPAEERLVPCTSVPLRIVYADSDLVAIDKPPSLPTLAGRTAGPSVAALLLARFPEMAAIDDRRAAGLVHRLDSGTSGLLLAARHPGAYERLRRELTRKAVVKEYLAVVHGRLARAGMVERPLARARRGGARMVGTATGGRGWSARTEYEPALASNTATLVRLRMRTGVTHQLRVHMAMLGHPIVGDARYGSPQAALGRAAPFARAAAIAGWHYLHAAGVRFDAPDLPRNLRAPFPRHWRALCAALGWRPAALRA